MSRKEHNQPFSSHAFYGESTLSPTSSIETLENFQKDEFDTAFLTPIRSRMTPEAVRKARSPPALIHSIDSKRMDLLFTLPGYLYFPVLFPSGNLSARSCSAKRFLLIPRLEQRRENGIHFIRQKSSCERFAGSRLD